MAFEGLMGKMRKGLAVAALGLASLMPTQEADAQVVNLGLNVYEANNPSTVVSNGGQLKQGTTYVFNMDLTAVDQEVDISSVLSTLNLTFTNGILPSDATFAYPSTLNGTPLTNDLFSNAVSTNNMAEQTFGPYQISSNQGSVNIVRSANFSAPSSTLSIGQTKNVASFYFTPNTSIGSINFNYSTGLNEAQVFGGENIGFDKIPSLTFMDYNSNSMSYSLAAVPEPSTYAAWAGAAALAGAAWHRRRQRKNAVATKTA